MIILYMFMDGIRVNTIRIGIVWIYLELIVEGIGILKII
jgi:hypothetical protein